MQRQNFPQETVPPGINGVQDRAGVLLNFSNPFQQYRMTSMAQQPVYSQQQLHMHMNTAPVNGGMQPPVSNGATTSNFTGMVNPGLVNSDLSPSNFTRAVNFDSQVNPRDVSIQHEMQGADMNHSIDTTSDIMEQQQAKEQAKAMQRFQQLRQMQIQQQQMLMMQQQQQLEHLRTEQEKVQRLLAKQRGAQWGDGRNGIVQNVQQLPSEAEIPNMHTPKKSTMSSIPQALAQGAMLKAKKNKAVLNQENPDINGADGDIPFQLGRPLPNIVASNTPEYLKERVNPNLDSDPDSRSLSTITDEGVFPLPDTASESSDPTSLQKVSWSNQPASSTPNHFSKTLFKDRNKENNVIESHNEELSSQIVNSHQEELHMQMNQTEFPANSHLMQMRKLPEFQGDPRVKITDGPIALSDSIIGQLAQELGMSPSDVAHVVQHLPVSNGQLAQYVEQGDVPTNDESSESVDESSEDQMEDIAEEDEDDEYVTDEEQEEAQDEVGHNGDIEGDSPVVEEEDRPISGIGARKKTFEELLEEELRKEEKKGTSCSGNRTIWQSKKENISKERGRPFKVQW